MFESGKGLPEGGKAEETVITFVDLSVSTGSFELSHELAPAIDLDGFDGGWQATYQAIEEVLGGGGTG
ncbi:MAG: hypothetical protein ACRDFX_04820 [Chloroflexota bacterium]